MYTLEMFEQELNEAFSTGASLQELLQEKIPTITNEYFAAIDAVIEEAVSIDNGRIHDDVEDVGTLIGLIDECAKLGKRYKIWTTLDTRDYFNTHLRKE